MTWANIGIAVASFVASEAGKKGTGEPAPNPGNIGGASPGLLGGDPNTRAISNLAAQGNFGQGTLEEAITPPASGQIGPPSPEVGPPESRAGTGDEQGLLSKFFGNLDTTFSSPSGQIGLGLLGQVNPALGGAGLLASGLFGNKLFGGK